MNSENQVKPLAFATEARRPIALSPTRSGDYLHDLPALRRLSAFMRQNDRVRCVHK
jgi:hypothetical protein